MATLTAAVAAPLPPGIADHLVEREPRMRLRYDPSLLPPMRHPADFEGDPSFRRTPAQQHRFAQLIDDAEALYGIPDVEPSALRRTVRANPRLRWVHTMAAGGGAQVRAADLGPEELTRIVFTSSAGVHGAPLAEFALFGLLGLLGLLGGAKSLPRLRQQQQRHEWAGRWTMGRGCSYLGSAAHRPHTQGGFVRYLTIGAHVLRALPAGLALRTAAVAEPAAVAWHAVARAGDVRGRRVLVIGAGPIGALVVAVLRRAGAAQINVVDLHQAPLDRARTLGATRMLLASDATALSAVQPDVTVESSGSVRGPGAAITATARKGRVVMLGLLPLGDQPVPIATAIERELVGSFRFDNEINDVLQALADPTPRRRRGGHHEYSIDDAHTALTTAADPVRSGKVLLRFTDQTPENPARNP